MEPLILLSFVISLLVTLAVAKWWVPTAHRLGIVGRDMNKYTKPQVAEMGGIAVVSGFVAGVLYYIALSTFYLGRGEHLLYTLAVLATVLIIFCIGLMDDLLGWKIGLKRWQKPLLTLAAALPMMAVNAGESSVSVPFLGSLELGLLYPLLVVPAGIAGAANGFNMLAGYNGLEAGMGVILLGALGYVSWSTGNGWVAVIAGAMLFSLLGFLRYNWYPARLFPGDSMTYSVGTVIACVAVLGNMEKLALVLFLPYFLDFLLPLRKRFNVEAFGEPRKDGSLLPRYDGIYDLTHAALRLMLAVRGRATERGVTLILLGGEAVLAALAVWWFLA